MVVVDDDPDNTNNMQKLLVEVGLQPDNILLINDTTHTLSEANLDHIVATIAAFNPDYVLLDHILQSGRYPLTGMDIAFKLNENDLTKDQFIGISSASYYQKYYATHYPGKYVGAFELRQIFGI